MYFPVSLGCSQPNSATPMSAARIAAQDARIARKGRHFTDGNAVLDQLMAKLTPPAPRPSAGDLQNSRGMFNRSPFPEPGGGPSPTVEMRTEAQTADWLAQWAASARAAAKNANYGTLVMPTVGGPAPGVSSAVPGTSPAGGSGSTPAGRFPVSFAVGESEQCISPEVLPLETVGRGAAVGARSSAPAAAPKPGVSPWLWLAIALGGVVLYQAAEGDA